MRETGSKAWTIRSLFLLLAVGWMIGIFCFSARNADLSSGDSRQVGMLVCSLIFPDYDSWPEAKQLAYADAIDHPVRKTAHACEYAVLALLLFGALFAGRARKLKWSRYFSPWILAALYAVSDELHQYFVPGRSCQLTDICIDSGGALAGLFLLYLFLGLWNWGSARKNPADKG